MDQSQGGYGGYNNYQAPAAYGATAAYPGYQVSLHICRSIFG